VVTPAKTADDDRVLDIRQDSEFAAGHVPGAAHSELGALAASAASLTDGPVTVMCGHGERAMSAASVLERAGHNDVSVLLGGPSDWSASHGVDLEVSGESGS
jgi:rhodanese-related sulfurtransferase